MYAGRTMEYGNARDVFYQPVHPYSIGLLNAVPRLDAEGETMLTIPGNPPNLLRLPKGCPFQPRCPHAMEFVVAHRRWKSLRLAVCVLALNRWRNCYECCN